MWSKGLGRDQLDVTIFFLPSVCLHSVGGNAREDGTACWERCVEVEIALSSKTYWLRPNGKQAHEHISHSLILNSFPHTKIKGTTPFDPAACRFSPNTLYCPRPCCPWGFSFLVSHSCVLKLACRAMMGALSFVVPLGAEVGVGPFRAYPLS